MQQKRTAYFAKIAFVICLFFISTGIISAQNINTIAGGGTDSTSSGIAAILAGFKQVVGVYVDKTGNIYIAEGAGNKVRKVNPAGVITTIAGTGIAGFSGDGGPATSALVNGVYGIYADEAGNVYLGSTFDFRIRKINTLGIITTIAGNGILGYSGDGGPSTAAQIGYTQSLTGDAAGNIYFTDFGNAVVRKISPAGIISTVAGTGVFGYSGDGGPAVSAQLGSPNSISIDKLGNIYIGDDAPYNVVRKITPAGIISTVAGNDMGIDDSGDGGAALAAGFSDIECAFADPDGNIYIADGGAHKVRKVTTDGIINTIAGTGVQGFSGDGGPAVAAQLSAPWAVITDKYGDIYIGEARGARVRKIAIPCTVVQPGLVRGNANVCPFINSGQQLIYSIDAVSGAGSYQWTVPPTVSIVSGQGTVSITVTVNSGFIASANKLIKVQAVFACGTSADRLFYLKAQLPGTPHPVIQGSANVCAFVGTGNAVSYTIPAVPGASAYNWISLAATNISHPNGTAANDTTVLITFANGFSGGTISVQSINDCGTSNQRSLLIQTNLPSRPGLVNGTTNVCENIAPGGTAITYSVLPVTAATSYNWSVPAGAVVTHPNGAGANDFSITVLFPNGFTAGNITVAASNGCGTSVARSLSVNTLTPSAPGAISVEEIAVCPNRVYNYSVTAMPANSNSIQWVVPAGGIILTGQGTSSVTVSYASTTVAGNVTATAISNCGSSQVRSKSVMLNACPGASATEQVGSPITAVRSGIPTDLQVAMKDPTLMLSPNPGVNDFKIRVLTAGKELIKIRILDISGRLIQTLTVTPYQTIFFGNDLKPGIYLFEVKQGKFTKTTRVVKL